MLDGHLVIILFGELDRLEALNRVTLLLDSKSAPVVGDALDLSESTLLRWFGLDFARKQLVQILDRQVVVLLFGTLDRIETLPSMVGNLNSKTVAVLAYTLDLRKLAWCYPSIEEVMKIVYRLIVLLLVRFGSSHEMLVLVTSNTDTISITKFADISTLGRGVLFDVLEVVFRLRVLGLGIQDRRHEVPDAMIGLLDDETISVLLDVL